MPTLKNPPADPPILIDKLPGGGFRITVTPPWRHWFSTIKTTEESHIADASTSHAVDSWATTNTALDALGTKINSILDSLETLKARATS